MPISPVLPVFLFLPIFRWSPFPPHADTKSAVRSNSRFPVQMAPMTSDSNAPLQARNPANQTDQRDAVPEPPGGIRPVGWKSPADTVPEPPVDAADVRGLEVVQLAGRGSFCDIWKVREKCSGRCFALKRLRGEWSDDSGAKRLLAGEAMAANAVAGRHVVRLEMADHEISPPFNLFPWIDGVALEQQLTPQRRLAAGTAVWIARQCAQGLNELAKAGYSHGDVKPQNVFIGPRGEVKLIDLGFASPLRRSRRDEKPPSMTGTPEYMAPESLSPAAVNPLLRDMYSLGVTLFRMVSGRLPFEAASTEQVLRLHQTARPPRLEPLCAEAPAELFDLVDRLLAKQPVRRPQSYGSLIRELTAVELATLDARFAA